MSIDKRIPVALGTERGSAHFRKVDVNATKAKEDDTRLDDLQTRYAAGIEEVKLTLEGMFDPDVEALLLSSYQGAEIPFIVAYTSDPSPGDLAALGVLSVFGHGTPLEAGAQLKTSVEDAAVHPDQWAQRASIGLLSYYDGGITASGNGTILDLGPAGVSEDQELRIVLNVARPFAGDIAFSLRSDSSATFAGSPVNRWVPANVTEPLGLYHTIPGPITDRYWRWEWAYTSGTGIAYSAMAIANKS